MKWLKFLGYSHSVPMVTSQKDVCTLLLQGNWGFMGSIPLEIIP